VDKEALDRSIARRLLEHIDNGTTDMADEFLELPVRLYTSDEHHVAELETLFFGHPQVLCLSGALAKPSTYTTTEILGVPLLLTRDAHGRVHSFANVCRHRGVRVADGSGDARRLTCPFHAWVYDLEGKLVGVPVAEGFEGMCREEKGLVELPVAEGYGLVVGRLRRGEPVDIDRYLGPGLCEELALLDFADWEMSGELHRHDVKSNWKVQLDTFRENYHFNYLHRTSLAEYAYGSSQIFDAFGPHLRNVTAIRSIDEIRGRPEEEWDNPAMHLSYQYAFFPSALVSFDYRHIDFWQVLPAGPHRSLSLHSLYLRPGLPPDQIEMFERTTPWICQEVVDGEDFWVAGRTEPGIQTGLSDTMVYGRNEPAPQHLNKGFLRALDASGPSQ
jgi:phenylpropionate dioxygenase-like ring-hydroxylating dioxygenase large terminal subunit